MLTLPQSYLVTTSAVHLTSALPLLLSPYHALVLLSPHPLSSEPDHVTSHLLRSYGLVLLILALLSLVLSGALPLSSLPPAAPSSAQATELGLMRTAVVAITGFGHFVALVSGYVYWSTHGGGLMAVGWGISGLLAAWSLGSLVFEGGKERGSGFMFPNEGKRERKEKKWERRFGGRKVA